VPSSPEGRVLSNELTRSTEVAVARGKGSRRNEGEKGGDAGVETGSGMRLVGRRILDNKRRG